jgi:hypothetical protein
MNDEDACLTSGISGSVKEMNVVLSKDHNWFVPSGKGSLLDVNPTDFRRSGRLLDGAEVERIHFAVRNSILGKIVRNRMKLEWYNTQNMLVSWSRMASIEL